MEKQKDTKEITEKTESKKMFRVVGFTIAILAAFLLLLGTTIVILRYSPELRDSLLGERGKEEESETSDITITEDENVIIRVVRRSANSVVSIAITRPSIQNNEESSENVNSIGTGFIVDPNGLIITNQHVVSNTDAAYVVITEDGIKYPVVEVVRDDSNDIAILKIDGKNLKTLELGDSENLLVGQTVIAIGTPLGQYAGSVTSGIISGLSRSVRTSSGWFGATSKVYENVIQTDAAVNPGNSGGPLISTEGKVIGVNFATSSGVDNISFALPINLVKQRIDEYRTYGKFIKPYIGISYQMISELEALYYSNVVKGALVANIDPSGPAAKANIKKGDIITKINDKEVEDSFSSVIQSFKVGDEIKVELWNDNTIRTVKVTLEEAN